MLGNDKIIIIALLIVLSLIIKTITAFHDHAHIKTKKNKAIQWRQPMEISKDEYQPINNKIWTLDYHQLEKKLWRIKKTDEGKIIVNDQTLTVLSQARSTLPISLNERELEHLERVLNKTFISTGDPSLATLMTAYLKYQPEYAKRLAEVKMVNGVKKRQLLESYTINVEQLQRHFFGEKNSEKLFKKQNRTINYLNQRQLINLDGSLSKQQKEIFFEKLKNSFKLSSGKD